MKVLQIHNEYFYKGGEDVVVEMEKKLLIKNKIEVSQLKRKNLNEIVTFFDKVNIAINLNFSNKSKQIVIDKINKIKPNIVHIHNTFPLWTYSIIDACYVSKIPVVMTLHNFRFICAKGVFFRKNKVCELCLNSSLFNAVKYGCYQNSILKSIPVALMINKYKRGLTLAKKVSKFIVMTDFSKKKLLQINFPENKIVIKPNFLFDIKTNPSLFLKKGFLYASRLSEEKGLFDLIEAHNRFNFDLSICGDGPLKNLLSSYKKIKYLGLLNKQQLLKILIKSKFLIFPSKCNETFGNLILEAFATGTVVIAPSLESISSIVKDKYSGILYKPGNINDLISKIKWALNNNNYCSRISRNAKKILKEKYSEKNNFQILKKIYEEVIRNYENLNY